jgi:predicted NBD/HSP70 family sugar kinase
MLVAVDTGGTKTLVAVFDVDGAMAGSQRFPTPRDTTEYIETVCRVIDDLTSGETPTALSIAIPGLINDGVAVWCGHLEWHNFNVRQAFAARYDVPIFIDNDANLAGLAEARALDPIPSSVLYVTVSTGIGTGVITNGQIDPGLSSSEGGHMLVEFDGRLQKWEDFASGSAIYETYGRYARDIEDAETWQQIADRISRGFLAAIPLLQPSVIIFGGSIGTYFDKYSTQLERLLKKQLPEHIPCPRLAQAAHPEEAVIYGCYYHAIDQSATA